jgi:hypothetical protein
MDFSLDDSQTIIDDLRIAINRSELQGQLELNYASIDQLIGKPEESNFDLKLKVPRLAIQDAYFFQPDLAQDTLLQKLERYPFEAELKLNGSPKLLTISTADLSWGQTNFFASGKVSDVLNMDLLRFDIPQIRIESQRETLTNFVSEKELGIQLPETFLLTGQASGSLSDLGTELQFESSLGDLNLTASYQDGAQLSFAANLEARAIQLNTLLQNPDLDTVYFSLDASGSGANWYEINADIKARFDSLELYQNDFSGLALSGNLENGSGIISSELESKNLRYDLSATVDLDSINSKASLHLNLKGADLAALGLTEKSNKAILTLILKGIWRSFRQVRRSRMQLFYRSKKTIHLGQFGLMPL